MTITCGVGDICDIKNKKSLVRGISRQFKFLTIPHNFFETRTILVTLNDTPVRDSHAQPARQSKTALSTTAIPRSGSGAATHWVLAYRASAPRTPRIGSAVPHGAVASHPRTHSAAEAQKLPKKQIICEGTGTTQKTTQKTAKSYWKLSKMRQPLAGQNLQAAEQKPGV